jgi:hypothetical protein
MVTNFRDPKGSEHAIVFVLTNNYAFKRFGAFRDMVQSVLICLENKI